MSQDASYAVKKHSACDECRSRKLKCSGEPSGCSRCVKDALPCRYSEQKQMGRPKKRLRDARDPFGDIDAGWVLDPDTDSSLLPQGLSDFGTELPPSVGSSGEGHHQPENEATGSSGMEYPSDLSGLLSSRQFELPSNYNNLPQFSQGNEQSMEPHSLISTHQYPLMQHVEQFQTDPSLSAQPPMSGGHDTINSASFTDSNPSQACSCVNELYQALSSLNSLAANPPQPAFPMCLSPLRSATSTAKSVIGCPHCKLIWNLGFQNMMLLATVLPLITDGYGRLLSAIDLESANNEAIGQKKRMRMGEPDMRLHTNQPGCPAGFYVELDPSEWRRIARNVVRLDVRGSGSGDSCGLQGVIDLLEQRQRQRHEDGDAGKAFGITRPSPGTESTSDREHFCLQLVENIRIQMRALDLSE